MKCKSIFKQSVSVLFLFMHLTIFNRFVGAVVNDKHLTSEIVIDKNRWNNGKPEKDKKTKNGRHNTTLKTKFRVARTQTGNIWCANSFCFTSDIPFLFNIKYNSMDKCEFAVGYSWYQYNVINYKLMSAQDWGRKRLTSSPLSQCFLLIEIHKNVLIANTERFSKLNSLSTTYGWSVVFTEYSGVLHHYIIQLLLKVALKTITITLNKLNNFTF